MTPQVRPALPGDHGLLDELRATAVAAAAGQRGGPELLASCTPPRWSDPGQTVFVATLDGAVVGYLRLVVDGDVASVAEVFVIAEGRDLGCGDGLLDAAMDAARAHGARRLDALALPGDRATKNLYERAGVVARAIILSTRLDG